MRRIYHFGLAGWFLILSSVVSAAYITDISCRAESDRLILLLKSQTPLKYKIRRTSTGFVLELAGRLKRTRTIPVIAPIQALHIQKAEQTTFVTLTLAEKMDVLPRIEQQGKHVSFIFKPRSEAWRVMLDYGHGGTDCGAIGVGSIREKDVVMAVGHRLAQLLRQSPGLHVELVRTRDMFVPLSRRLAITRQAQPDLFISLHADACTNPHVQGAAVYTLSQKGASTSMAKWLAYRENRADLVGDVKIKGQERTVAAVLLDMYTTATKKSSQHAARFILQELGQVTQLYSPTVEHGEFFVLKLPDIPALLIELGFLSHRASAYQLQDPAFQQRLAQAIFSGIRTFFLEKIHTQPQRLQPSLGRRYNKIGIKLAKK